MSASSAPLWGEREHVRVSQPLGAREPVAGDASSYTQIHCLATGMSRLSSSQAGVLGTHAVGGMTFGTME